MTQPAATTLWAIVLGLLCAIYLAAALVFSGDGGPATGWLVSDGVTLYHSALDDTHLGLRGIVDSYQSAAALAWVNATLVALHPLTPALLNYALLAAAFGLLARHGAHWPLVVFLLVPYYLAAFPLPSKDTLVATLSLVAMLWFANGHRPRLLPALALAGVMFFVRDGYGLVLAAAFGYVWLSERCAIGARKALVLLLVACAAFWSAFEGWFEGSFLYARAMGVAEQGAHFEEGASSSAASYLVRLLGNATNLAFRPVFFDEQGGLHLVSLFYWISGLMLLHTLVCCVQGLTQLHWRDRRLGLLGLCVLLLVSLTPYVQPRYLLPLCLLVPVFSFSNLVHLRRSLTVIVAVSCLASIAYQAAGNYPPPAERISFQLGITLP